MAIRRNQAIGQKVKELQQFFQQKYRINPFTDRGYEDMVSTEGLAESFLDLVSNNITDDEKKKRIFKTVMNRNTKAEVNSLVSEEGLDVAGGNANYTPMSTLNAFAVLGYLARCDVMDLFQIVEGEDPLLSWNYDLTYWHKGSDRNKKNLLRSIRDGSIKGATQLPELVPIVSPENPHIENLAGKIWIKLGSRGQLLDETDFGSDKYELERNITIAHLRGTYGVTNIVFEVAVNVRRAYMSDTKSSKRALMDTIEDLVLPVAGGIPANTKVTFDVQGNVDLSSSVYSVNTSGVSNPLVTFTHFQFGHARPTNIAKELDNVKVGNEVFNVTLDVENKMVTAVPLTNETLDDFRTASGVDYVTHAVDTLSEMYAGIRSVDMEGVLDDAFALGPKGHILAPKLGGFKFETAFPMNQTTSGSHDPFELAEKALRRAIGSVLTDANYDMDIPAGVASEWVAYGSTNKVKALLNEDFTNVDGATGEANRFNFSVGSRYGYASNLGGRVKIIGNDDPRYKDKPISIVFKTDDRKAPFFLYYPYRFRIYKGRPADAMGLDALCVYQRDFTGAATLGMARFDITGLGVDQFNDMSAYSTGH